MFIPCRPLFSRPRFIFDNFPVSVPRPSPGPLVVLVFSLSLSFSLSSILHSTFFSTHSILLASLSLPQSPTCLPCLFNVPRSSITDSHSFFPVPGLPWYLHSPFLQCFLFLSFLLFLLAFQSRPVFTSCPLIVFVSPAHIHVQFPTFFPVLGHWCHLKFSISSTLSLAFFSPHSISLLVSTSVYFTPTNTFCVVSLAHTYNASGQ